MVVPEFVSQAAGQLETLGSALNAAHAAAAAPTTNLVALGRGAYGPGIYADGRVVVGPGGRIIVDGPGNSLNVAPGGEVVVGPRSSIYIFPGGSLNVGYGSRVFLGEHTNLTIGTGDPVTVAPNAELLIGPLDTGNGTLRNVNAKVLTSGPLDINSSIVLVKRGTALIIEDDTPVTINHGIVYGPIFRTRLDGVVINERCNDKGIAPRMTL
jgi:hypothetical protein